MLELGDDDSISGAEVGVAPGAGDEVDGLRRVADEDDLAAVGGADVVGERCPSALVRRRRLGRERVRAAVDVGVVAALVAIDRLDRSEYPLRAGAGVQVGDGPAVDLAGERRERVADARDIEPGHRRLGHAAASTSSRIHP
jgi:hypothetical protein